MILGFKNNESLILATSPIISEWVELFWTCDTVHGELLIEVDRIEYLVKTHMIDFDKKELKTYKTFSMLPHVDMQEARNGKYNVSSGISRVLVGFKTMYCFNPFTGKVDDIFHFSLQNNEVIKDISPNWPGKEIVVSVIRGGIYSFVVCTINVSSVFPLKSLAAIEVVFNYSLDELRKLKLPRNLKYILNL